MPGCQDIVESHADILLGEFECDILLGVSDYTLCVVKVPFRALGRALPSKLLVLISEFQVKRVSQFTLEHVLNDSRRLSEFWENVLSRHDRQIGCVVCYEADLP
jgi:hypothetical protein